MDKEWICGHVKLLEFCQKKTIAVTKYIIFLKFHLRFILKYNKKLLFTPKIIAFTQNVQKLAGKYA
jgi:hypothetical protein